MLEKYYPKIIDKEVFVKYYFNKGPEAFIDDMETICGTSKELKSERSYRNLQDITQKGIDYMLNLPIGGKAKSILTSAADNIDQRKKFQKAYKNTVLVLEELVQNYKELFEKATIYELVQLRGLY